MNSAIRIPRYLSTSSATETWDFDAVVIGSGVAGLMSAMKLAPKMRVALITKERLADSNSFYAQGGISAVIHENDSIKLWKKDTIGAGVGLCREEAIEQVAKQMTLIIHELESMGVPFDVDSSGNLQLGREAFHSVRRILHAGGDQTGRFISKMMCKRLEGETSAVIFEESFVIDILVDDNGEVAGLTAVVDDSDVIFKTPNVILSTGGCGQVYSHTSNPLVATGDGIAMAMRAGVTLVDMEFIQFHPTVCFANPSKPFLVTEAIRGEKARLLNDNNERFMLNYSDHAELAPRDIVAKACYEEMLIHKRDWVLLDTTIFDHTFFKTRFPTVFSQCISAGFDPTEQPIPVAPGAHYMIGGVETNGECRTSLPGLYVAGEAGSTGMHGANRLASNSLPEGLVNGLMSAGTVISDGRKGKKPIRPEIAKTSEPKITRSELRVENWNATGVIRNKSDMAKHLEELITGVRYPFPQNTLGAMEHANLFTVSTAITLSALTREESRGVHNRSDFSKSTKEWGDKRVHIKGTPSEFYTDIKTGTHNKEDYSWT